MAQRSAVPTHAGQVPVLILAYFSGFAALSWEVIWQIKSSLALGVSALGTALTLAVTMAEYEKYQEFARCQRFLYIYLQLIVRLSFLVRVIFLIQTLCSPP